MRIYISGAISSDINYAEKFERYSMALIGAGHLPISPAELPSCLTEGEYMQLDHILIGFADAVLMLPDWKDSRGSTIEYQLAKYSNKPVFFAEVREDMDQLGLKDREGV